MLARSLVGAFVHVAMMLSITVRFVRSFLRAHWSCRSGLGCYNPWNYQSRALQSYSQNPHKVHSCSKDFEPSFDGAVAEMLRMGWVGLTDFFHESLCLLTYRIGGASHPYVHTCACDSDGEMRVIATAATRDVHIDHTPQQKQGAIVSHLDLDPFLSAKVDRLTVVDRFVVPSSTFLLQLNICWSRANCRPSTLLLRPRRV